MNSLDDSLWVNHPMSSRNKLLCTFIFYSLLKLTSPIVWYLLEGPERHVLTQKRPHAKHEILSSPSDICEKAQRSSLSWDWVVSSAVCLSFRLSHIFQAQFWWKTCSNYGSKVDSVDIWWWRLCCHVTVSLQKHISGQCFLNLWLLSRERTCQKFESWSMEFCGFLHPFDSKELQKQNYGLMYVFTSKETEKVGLLCVCGDFRHTGETILDPRSEETLIGPQNMETQQLGMRDHTFYRYPILVGILVRP